MLTEKWYVSTYEDLNGPFYHIAGVETDRAVADLDLATTAEYIVKLHNSNLDKENKNG